MKLDLPATYEFLWNKTSRPRKNSPKWIPAESTKGKPLGQESSQENLSAKEEFTQVNPCREYERKPPRPLGQESWKKTSRPRKNSPKWVPVESTKEKPLGLSTKRVRKKTSRPKITSSVCLSPLHVHAPRVQVTTLDIQQQSNHEHTRHANTHGNSTLRYV